MTEIVLLDALQAFIKEQTKNIMLSTRPEKGGTVKGTPGKRAAEVHKMRLPDKNAETKRIPYVLLQVITGVHEQNPGYNPEHTCKVRIIIATYSEDGGEGANDVLNVLTRIRVALLKAGEVGEQFLLRSPVEYIIYPEDTNPYYFGEIMSVWEMPHIKREINALLFDEITTETEVM
ncbi:MAG: hypothetical protein FWC70_10025 [Defluviitaleaceae bacterium]|nr:hypothetical protein [Defluviitaleaceae bacterium]